jgi:hypothetical protein
VEAFLVSFKIIFNNLGILKLANGWNNPLNAVVNNPSAIFFAIFDASEFTGTHLSKESTVK